MLGIEPSHVHDPGEKHGARSAPFKHGQWALHSPLPESVELEGHLRWLLDLLLPVRMQILDIVKSDARLKVDFFCGLYLREWNEGLMLTPRTLADMASLNAELALDMYYEGDAAEDTHVADHRKDQAD